jgi:hypothetical protein
MSRRRADSIKKKQRKCLARFNFSGELKLRRRSTTGERLQTCLTCAQLASFGSNPNSARMVSNSPNARTQNCPSTLSVRRKLTPHFQAEGSQRHRCGRCPCRDYLAPIDPFMVAAPLPAAARLILVHLLKLQMIGLYFDSRCSKLFD